MKTTNWNFYLCNESRNKEYLELKCYTNVVTVVANKI